jgi:hypothetical protein
MMFVESVKGNRGIEENKLNGRACIRRTPSISRVLEGVIDSQRFETHACNKRKVGYKGNAPQNIYKRYMTTSHGPQRRIHIPMTEEARDTGRLQKAEQAGKKEGP